MTDIDQKLLMSADEFPERRRIFRTVTIEIWERSFGGSDFTVREGERYADRLCCDEILGSREAIE